MRVCGFWHAHGHFWPCGHRLFSDCSSNTRPGSLAGLGRPPKPCGQSKVVLTAFGATWLRSARSMQPPLPLGFVLPHPVSPSPRLGFVLPNPGAPSAWLGLAWLRSAESWGALCSAWLRSAESWGALCSAWLRSAESGYSPLSGWLRSAEFGVARRSWHRAERLKKTLDAYAEALKLLN